MSSTVKFGLVGAGSIAQSYAQAFLSTQSSELVAVADVDQEKVNALCAKTNAKGYTNIEKMVAENKLDAAIICTPPSTHCELSLFFLEQGIHVLCEKPITINRQSLQVMLQAAKKAGRLISMASKFRYVKDVMRAKQMFELGLLGEVVLYENAFMSQVDMRQRWNSNPAVSGGGVFIDNGTHSVDIMRYLLGPIRSIKVVEGKRTQGLKVDETAHILVRSVNNVLGRIDLSWSVKQDNPNFITVNGSHGSLRIGWKESSYSLHSTEETVIFGPGYDKVGAFTSQINNFSDAVCGRAESLISEADIIASVDVIEAGYRSLKSEQWETIMHSDSPASRPAAPAMINVQPVLV